ncbi:MAG TPA: nuclear transport factor 2 family protein [Candidatus Dormibacteraeota bacterium]
MSRDDLESRVEALEAKEAIKELKHRYMRCLDRNDVEGLAGCFAVDANTWYTDGKYTFDGRDAIVQFLGRRKRLSLHTAHHAEISLLTPTTAKGIWALEDTNYREDGTVLHGAGYYQDTYVKVEGEWKIQSSGYDRTFEQVVPVVGTLKKGPRAWVGDRGEETWPVT